MDIKSTHTGIVQWQKAYKTDDVEHVPGLLKYDVCMTEQVSGPQGPKIAGRHMAMIPQKLGPGRGGWPM